MSLGTTSPPPVGSPSLPQCRSTLLSTTGPAEAMLPADERRAIGAVPATPPGTVVPAGEPPGPDSSGRRQSQRATHESAGTGGEPVGDAQQFLAGGGVRIVENLSLIHISEPTRLGMSS